MSADSIAIKGVREGLIVTLPAAPEAWPDVLALLEARLGAGPAFFKGARVGLVVGARELTEADVRTARDMLLRHDVTLWALIGESTATQDVAAHLGLDTRLPPPLMETRPLFGLINFLPHLPERLIHIFLPWTWEIPTPWKDSNIFPGKMEACMEP